MADINAKITAGREMVLAIIRARFDSVPTDVEKKVNLIDRWGELEELAQMAVICVTFEQCKESLDSAVAAVAFRADFAHRWGNVATTDTKTIAWREAMFAIIRAKFDEIPPTIENIVNNRISLYAKRKDTDFQKDLVCFASYAVICESVDDFVRVWDY
jgi:hypothetical protein